MLISSTSFKISFSCVICVLNSLTDFSHSLYAFSAFNNSALFCSIFFSSFDFSFKAAVLFSNLSFPRKFSFRLFCSSIAAEYEDISALRFVIDSLILLIFLWYLPLILKFRLFVLIFYFLRQFLNLNPVLLGYFFEFFRYYRFGIFKISICF